MDGESRAADTQARRARGEAMPLAPLSRQEVEQIDSLEEPEPSTPSSASPDGGLIPPLENFPSQPLPREFERREVPDDIVDLESYRDFLLEEMTRQNRFEAVQARERELDDRVEQSEAAAQRRWPDYMDTIDDWVVPLIKRDYRIFSWLRSLNDPCSAAYQLGRQVRDRYEARAGGEVATPRRQSVGSRTRFPKKMTKAEINATSHSAWADMLDQWHAEGQPD